MIPDTYRREVYERMPIDRSTRSIRLLSILGRESVLLQTFELISAPRYIALSYTWGDPFPPPEPHDTTVLPQSAKSPDRPWPIQVNGRAFKITKNLGEFLRHAGSNTYSNHGQWYWVDALCINQDDSEERTHQVGMMGDIYSAAALVHIWLGPGTRHSDNAIDYMKKAIAWGGSVMYVSDYVESCMKSLFHRTYWSRIWIFQEVLLAETITVTCGAKTMTWEALDRFHDMLVRAQRDKVLKGTVDSIFGSNALRLIKNKKTIQQLKPINMAVALAHLIEATTPMEATDQRDKVYALLGLSERLGSNKGLERKESLDPSERLDPSKLVVPSERADSSEQVGHDCEAPRLQVDYEKAISAIVTDVLRYMTEGGAFQPPVLGSTDWTANQRITYHNEDQLDNLFAYRPRVRSDRRPLNKLLVTMRLKDSLRISAEDAYVAARESGTMTETELKQLPAVLRGES